MAIELFQIEWTKPYLFGEALHAPEASESGVYALFRSHGESKKLHYVGKTADFRTRFGTHKRAAARMLTDAELKKCSVCFGLVWSFEKTRLSRDVTPEQLGRVERFLINRLQPTGCGTNTKLGYASEYPMIVVNAGKVIKPFEKIMSHNPDILKLLGKKPTTTTTKKRKAFSAWDF